MKLELALVLLLSSANSCVAIVPMIEPDAKGRGVVESARHIPAGPSNQSARPRMASPQEPRLEKLIREMNHENVVVRTHAAFWLGEMGAKARPAVPVLVANLTHRSNWVRRASAKALGKIGASEAVPGLIKTLHDRDKYVAHSAANALRRIGTNEARLAVASYKGI